MVVLVVILIATLGLAVRARMYTRLPSPAESANATGLADTCLRTFVLVFLSLVGLTALGIMYGNVLGSAGTSP